MSLEVGQVFAGYRILRVLGAGGMGTVYLASHPRLPREEALKVLPTELTGDREYRGRFLREAELASGLSHPHIVGIHDRGEDDGQFWISMDYVAGTDVARLLRENYPSGMPLDEVVPIISAVASALDYAHHRGLLHRDVKPANILLTDPDGQARRVFLADFGIARHVDDASRLTAANTTVGTVAYVAPEQLKGERVDARADQYSLACTAFQMLAGAPPYDHANPTVVINHHVNSPPPPIGGCRPELAGLGPIFATAMAKKPSARFGSCGEFARQLGQRLSPGFGYAHDGPVPLSAQHTQPAIAIAARPPRGKALARRPGVVIAALVVVALLIVGGVFAVVKLTQPSRRAATAPSKSATAQPNTAAPPANTGTAPPTAPTVPLAPFTGTYRANFGPVTDPEGNPVAGAAPSTGTYGLRSACGGAGCVATALRLSGETDFASRMVFDGIGGRWVAVALSASPCRGAVGEIWEVFTLQPNPDGTLTGQHTRSARNNCQETRTVTFTHTGDVDLNSLPDPAILPPRVVSPAEAFHGHYQLTRTFTNGEPQLLGDNTIVTECLRSGYRCMSYFHAKMGDVPLVFGGGSWTWDESSDGKCPNGSPAHLNANGQYPLPQPPQNPIALLSGHGHWQQNGSCAVNLDFDETFTRTGD
jgi:serine/threonine protein kinase, bacterial